MLARPPIIDFHTHVFPDRLEEIGVIGKLRKQVRHWMRPFMATLHESQTFLRVIPEGIRKPIDELAMFTPLAGLLFESTATDLRDSMEESNVDYSVLIAHPPYLMNEQLLELCQQYPQFIPAVNIGSGTAKPGSALRSYIKKGAKLLKIHPAFDGEGADSPRYKSLLKIADEQGLPVILHTGCFHSRLFFKDPELGKVQNFAPWFENYKKVRFVLAHMNLHEPAVALDLAEEFPNLFVDTSWQPSETIGEAVRRLGAERVLFGSDWPLVGNNIAIGLKRIQECIEMGTINSAQATLIQGGNAQKLLELTHGAS
jgi:predicted TIM-barrel fold metal-dependent hydrolase